jgi:hypothetical protein
MPPRAHCPLQLVVLEFALLALVLGAGCTGPDGEGDGSEGRTGSHVASPEPLAAAPGSAGFENAFPSAEVLVEAVLDALRRKDAPALAAMRVTEKEYKEIVWPELPQANDPRHTLSVDFHWTHLDIRSREGIREALSRYGGVDFELVEILPTGGIKEHSSYRILNRVKLRVRRREDGKEGEIRVFGSIVELGGQAKIVGFPS